MGTGKWYSGTSSLDGMTDTSTVTDPMEIQWNLNYTDPMGIQWNLSYTDPMGLALVKIIHF